MWNGEESAHCEPEAVAAELQGLGGHRDGTSMTTLECRAIGLLRHSVNKSATADEDLIARTVPESQGHRIPASEAYSCTVRHS
jgi:hypothetical protein